MDPLQPQQFLQPRDLVLLTEITVYLLPSRLTSDVQDLTSSFLNTAIPTLTVQEVISIVNYVGCEASFTALQDFTLGTETFSADPIVVTVPDELTTFTITWNYPTATLTNLFTLGTVAEVVRRGNDSAEC
jgi:hypothetical protein